MVEELFESRSTLGPRAARRPQVVPAGAAGAGGDTAASEPAPGPAEAPDDALTPRAGGQMWADLMRRTYGFDVLACPRCGGRLRLVALIEQAAVIGQILRHLGLPTEIPAARPARAPPLPIGLGAHPMNDSAAFDSCS